LVAAGSVIALLLAASAPAPSAEWAPVAITDNDGTTVYFVDRTSMKSEKGGVSAWTYAVGPSVALRLHFEYDDIGRWR
jgi:hypothetical protein